jgi:predicted RNase H-like HicB family nuclease
MVVVGLGVAEKLLKVELEQEADGRWLAEVIELPGVLAYGNTREEALAKAEALALRVIADRLEHGERAPELNNLFIAA